MGRSGLDVATNSSNGRQDRVNGGTRGTGVGTAAPGATEGWTLDTGGGSMSPRTAIDVLNDIRTKVATGELADYEPVPLGITPMDRMLGGGLRPGELMLIGGAQGTGKTTLALQMARNIAASGQAYVLYVNFEHDDADMLNRLIAMSRSCRTCRTPRRRPARSRSPTS